MRKLASLTVLFLLISWQATFSQDSLTVLERVANFPTKIFDQITKKSSKLQEKLVKSTETALKRLQRQEQRLKRKLGKKDSVAAEDLFGDVDARFNILRDKLQAGEQRLSQFKKYIPELDTLKVSLDFIAKSAGSFIQNNKQAEQLKAATSGFRGLEDKLQSGDVIRKYIQERRLQLKDKLSLFGLHKELSKYNKQVYYYSQQLKEYQDILKDPEKIQRKAIELLTKLPAFQKFFQKHSEFAQLFPLPYGNGTSQSLAGLQTRAGVQSLIQQQLSVAGPNAKQVLQEGIQQAQSQLNQWKKKITELGGGGSEIDVPDFKNPNSQKVKSFWKRLEIGTDIQNTRGSSFLPITSDLGFSIAYKLNDRNSLGLGTSYKVGWGKDIRRITITNEGIGLRSFIDLKLKGSFFVSGGYEQNYRNHFQNLAVLRSDTPNWMQSGLIGLKKKYAIGSKAKGNVQLLFDFLYKSHSPQTQPVLFRFGYGF